MESSFEQTIAEHLELKRRSCGLEQLPPARYPDGGAPAFTDEADQPVGRGDLPTGAADPVSWWDAANTTWESVSGFNWGD
jgi:hypothetical protein